MEYRRAYRWGAVWILFCAWCQCIPWVLGLFGQLNRWGYLAAILASAPVVYRVGKQWFRLDPIGIRNGGRLWWNRARRRPVFGLWLLLFGAALIGGVLYPPTNHDGLTYRFPRILHWFWEGRWHWIENPAEPQMNLSTHGFEWLTAFLFALTGSDRQFFLINLVSFALLPGLLFAFLVRLGVNGRVASWWMWIFPCGYGLALQAGSIGNDLFAIPYVLAGVVFALRATESKSVFDVALAILAAALITGTKLSNAPLVLPIAAALAMNLGWVLRWRNAPTILGVTVAGLLASAAPVMLACIIHTGHFSGDPENSKNLNVENPAAGLVANSLQVASRNLMPPVNPAANWWNARYQGWLPESATKLLAEGYPRFHLNMTELPQEEGDGLGLGITLLILLSLGLGFFSLALPRNRRRGKSSRTAQRWISLAVLAATLIYLVKMGSEAAPRLMLPYYGALLFLVLGFEVNRRFIRARWWPILATAAAGFVVPAVILSPNRPLVPVRTLLSSLPESVLEKPGVRRVATVYETYAARHDAMAPLRQWLPDSRSGACDRIGFIGDGRSLRTGLWRPFGSRKVDHLSDQDALRDQPVGALVLDAGGRDDREIAALARSARLELKGIASVPNYAGKPPERYAVLVPMKAKTEEKVAMETSSGSAD